jgi:hypothetical protein
MGKSKGGIGLVVVTAIGLYGLYKFSNKSQALERISYILQEVKLKLQKGLFLVRIDVIVMNPTNETLRFKDFSGTLFADSQKIGDINIPNPVNILPKSQTKVELQAFVPLAKAANLLLNSLLTMKLPTRGLLKGTLRVGNIQLPVEEEFKFNEPTKS